MTNTLQLFNERSAEIDFYFSMMSDIEEGKINTSDNSKFQRILKSNCLLMLYNLVESCITNGLFEIYEYVKTTNAGYNDLIDEIRLIWSNIEIGKTYSKESRKTAYEERVQKIIDQVIKNQPIILTRESIMLTKQTLNMRGNLDARVIKKLCDKHGINHTAKDDNGYLRTVKEKRNILAHGDDSFGECARDISLQQLRDIKDGVKQFIDGILAGMKIYYDNRCFLRQNEKEDKEPPHA